MENLALVALVTAGIYLLIVFCLRITGKKGLSEMSVTDLVFIMLLSESFDVITGEDNKVLGAIVSIATLTIVNYGLDWATFKSKRLRKILDGVPVVIIRNGKVISRNMKKEMLTMDNVKEALRGNGIRNISEVSLGILEEDGEISIISKSK
jgi:uncharacterized membrane protein YcaP (DUF421 family)